MGEYCGFLIPEIYIYEDMIRKKWIISKSIKINKTRDPTSLNEHNSTDT